MWQYRVSLHVTCRLPALNSYCAVGNTYSGCVMGRIRCLGFNTARVLSRESLKLIKENDWKQLCSTISPASACEELTRGLQGSSSWRFRVTVWFYFELSTSAIFSRGWISSFFNLNDTSVPWPYMTCNATCTKHILVSNALIYVL